MKKYSRKHLGIIVVLSFLSSESFAQLSVGLGFNNVTQSQAVPALTVETQIGSWAWNGSTAGYASQYDYLSVYTLTACKPIKVGQLFSFDIEAGFGGGVYLTQRGYRATTSAAVASVTDPGIGPAFYVKWNLGWFYIRGESIAGVGSGYNLTLLFQDVSSFSMGVTW